MNKKNLSESKDEFQESLLKWFEEHQRKLPWRGVQDPYLIWVSEVMLQQTQVIKVIDYYQKFIERFPNVQQLAAAPLQDVLKVWEGLGYYARARNLHKAAVTVITELDGEIPKEYDTFRKLSGVGDYSAAAVLSIAFDQPYAAVDGNIKRVLSRLYQLEAPVNDASSTKVFQQHADELLDRQRPGLFNQAMMELGATICRPQSPTCLVCPVKTYCEVFHKSSQSEYPKRRTTKAIPEHQMVAAVIYRESKVLLIQRPLDGLLGGLWEFPNGRLTEDETSEKGCFRIINETVNVSISNLQYLTRVKHAFTHYKIVVDVFQCDYVSGEVVLDGPIDAKWVDVTEVSGYPLPRATHKFLEQSPL